MTTTIQITESFKSFLDQFSSGYPFEASRELIGTSVVKAIQDRFHSLPANERGFPSAGFWQRAAEATSFVVTDDGILIVISQTGVRQRYFGGSIRPTHARYLSVPAIAESYGCRAVDFSDLKVVRGDFETWWGSHTGLALAADEGDSQKIYFWLLAEVHQEPNHDVLPSDNEIFNVALEAIDHQLDTSETK